MSKGDVTGYTQLKKMDVFEFFPFLDKWKARQEQIRNQIKQQNNGSRKR